MSDVANCPQCGSVVRYQARHCPMCGAEIPPHRQFGISSVPPPPPDSGLAEQQAAARKKNSKSGFILAAGCLIFLALIGISLFFAIQKIGNDPGRFMNKIVRKVVDQQARDTAEKFFKLLDAGDFDAAWNMGDNGLRKSYTRKEFQNYMLSLRRVYGPRVKPMITGYKFHTAAARGGATTTHAISFTTEFEKGTADEQLTLVERGGRFTVHAYKGPKIKVVAQGEPRGRSRKPFPMPVPEPGRPEQDGPADSSDVDAAMSRFFDHLDAGDFASAWDMGGPEFQRAFSRGAFLSLMKDIKAKLGARKDRRGVGYNTTSIIAGGVSAVTYTVTFHTTFTKGGALEEITLNDINGDLSVLYYSIQSDAVAMPDVPRPDPFHQNLPRTQPAPEPQPKREIPATPRTRGLDV